MASQAAPGAAPCAVEPFKLERYFARFEFDTSATLLCSSDATPLSVSELLGLADADSRSQWDALTLGYTEPAGLPALREEIARLHGDCRAEHVLCCVPQEGVLLAHSLLQRGQHVVVTAPGYQSLHSLAEAMGCEVSPWLPARKADGTLHFDVAELRQLVRPGVTAMVVINFPHNPTGCLPTRAELDEIVSIARDAGAILFSDEMYRFLQVGSEPYPSAAALYPRAVALGGLSKSHSCPGLRCGWLVTQDAALRARLCEAKDYTTICGAAPSEVLGLMALRAGGAIVAANRAVLAANLALLNAFFARHAASWEWSPPAGGTVGFPRLLTGESADAFCDRVLAGCGVLLLPSSVYHFVPPGEQRVRIGFGRRDMPAVLARLEAFLTAP